MKIHLAIPLIGTFALDEEGTVVDVRYFKLDPVSVSQKICQLAKGELPTELKNMLKEHKDDEIAVREPELGRILADKGFKILADYDHPVIDRFYREIVSYLINSGIFPTEQQYLKFIRETSLLITRERVRQAAEKRDRLIVHAIETIDDLDKTLNLFSNRLREFYGMHFPELVDAISTHQTFALIVSKTGDKSKITKDLLVDEIGLPESKAEELLAARKKSMGSPLLAQDIKIIKDQAQTIVELYNRRYELEKWMEEAMRNVAPNISGVVGPLLGARLISLAGSLRALALCPSSKIQVLGAEKALYRTIRTGAPPPKHGIIFQYPSLNQAKWWQRGKIARVIAGRLSIAARMDFFEAEDKSKEFATEILAKITEIKEKYPKPPERKKKDFQKKKSPAVSTSRRTKSKKRGTADRKSQGSVSKRSRKSQQKKNEH